MPKSEIPTIILSTTEIADVQNHVSPHTIDTFIKALEVV